MTYFNGFKYSFLNRGHATHDRVPNLRFLRKRQVTENPQLINAEIEVVVKIRANGKGGILDSATSKETLVETSDLIYSKLNTVSLEIVLADLETVVDCLLDDCETEQLYEHKPGELNLNHTYQITGVYEESVYLDGITSTPSQMILRPPSTTSKPSTSIAPSMRPSAPPQTTLRPPSSTSKPSMSIGLSMRPSEPQDKTTCSNSPDLCAQFGILDLQVTCIDKSFDGQQQVIIDEYLIQK